MAEKGVKLKAIFISMKIKSDIDDVIENSIILKQF